MPDALSLVAWVVDRDRREEILGDLCELRTRESVAAFWGDVVGVCVHATRVRRWLGTAAAMLACTNKTTGEISLDAFAPLASAQSDRTCLYQLSPGDVLSVFDASGGGAGVSITQSSVKY